jgi:hypothetical protein
MRMTGDSVQDSPAAASRPRIALLGAAGVLELASHLRSAGADVLDGEPAPDAASDHLAARFGYRRLSARTGDVGGLSALVAILQSAKTGALAKNWIWQGRDGRLRDGFRITVDPDGIADVDELILLRKAHLRALQSVLRDADVLILLLSCDGCLVDSKTGTRYPFDSAWVKHCPKGISLTREFADMARLNDDFVALRVLLADLNPRLQLRLALLPSPAGEQTDFATRLPQLRHQSDLRVLMAHWAATMPGVSYLPLWELCTGALAQAGHFSVGSCQLSAEGGAALARLCLGAEVTEPAATDAAAATVEAAIEDVAKKRARRAERRAKRAEKSGKSASVVCEEELLEAFSR